MCFSKIEESISKCLDSYLIYSKSKYYRIECSEVKYFEKETGVPSSLEDFVGIYQKFNYLSDKYKFINLIF